ncbi:AC3 protein [Tomato leaf curl China virus - OX2]|uniref:Replication enhancer n=1 Tax=Tomato leaf curl China virus TaxID=229636 RepID=A0A144I6J8_9GEMI|nr:AC3 protein [Tomato leaf curl China virus - OX2]AGK90095.1 AC3 protein [Tomato leaf curl China virus - OX2]AMT74381.1 AC3 protein [Tomato leaf curl China virus]AMT74393.1 AC3 protein [Tomato leaf curl China virus]AMT74399.1 AC3 protein [Tomato leaf curl China virus]
MDSRTGELITATQAENGVFIWEITNPLYFKITELQNRPFLSNNDIVKVRIQFNYNLRKALGMHQCFLDFRIWTNSHLQTGRFLRVFRTQVLKFLNNLGVISLNNVIRAVNYVLWDALTQTTFVQSSHVIKFNLY